MVAAVSRRAALLVADALLCVLRVWETGAGRAAAPVVVCAALTGGGGGGERAGELLRGVIMHDLWRVYTGGIVGIFLFVLALSFHSLCSFGTFFSIQRHINEISAVPGRPALGWEQTGAEGGRRDHACELHTHLSDINMRSVGPERRAAEYSSGLMWMSATDIAVD